MGVEIDCQTLITKTKLTASQYEQPVNQLDLVTQSTEPNDLQTLLRILNLVQGRLRNQFSATQQLVSLMLQVNEDHRLFVTFLQMPRFQERENVMQNRLGRRIESQSPRHSFQERSRNEQQILIPRMPQRPRLLPLQRLQREQEHPRRQRLQMIQRPQIRQLNFLESIQISRNPHPMEFSDNRSIESSNFDDFHERILPPIFSLPSQFQREALSEVSEPQNLSINYSRNIMPYEIREGTIHNNDENRNGNSLNQNSQYPIRQMQSLHSFRTRARREEQAQEEPTSCWQFLLRTFRNFFGRFR